MKVTEYIENKICRLPKGYIFTYSDLVSEAEKREAAIKALNRMVVSGKIAKLAKGKYYKPEETVFGNLQPDQDQIVKDLMKSNGKMTGYPTGLNIYRQLHLTSQISNAIQIGKNEIRPSLKRGNYMISFMKQKNIITKANIPLLQILDAIKDIKKIPDSSVESSCKRLLAIIQEMSENNKVTMVRLAAKYPPAARALLGALLEETGSAVLAGPLHKNLNPITVYKLPGAARILSESKKWNIK